MKRARAYVPRLILVIIAGLISIMSSSGTTYTLQRRADQRRGERHNQTITAKKAFTVSKAQGKVTYKKASGNKKITVSSAGKVTVKKGLKKGTYKVKVKVTAAGTTEYKTVTKTVTIKVKVK